MSIHGSGGRSLRVLETGPSCTIQDLGRHGWFSVGVGVAGAADPISFTLANRLVANDEGAAAIECLLGGLEIEATAPTLVAVTGAPAPITVDGRPYGHASVIALRAGQRLKLGMAATGMRSYLAVRGGIAVAPVMGSRSRDTLAGIGPEPVQPGIELPIGPPPAQWPSVAVAPVKAITGDKIVVRAVPGPREDWFVRPDHLFTASWLVSDQVDRVGIRLDRPAGAPALERINDKELPTEGMPLGAIQVPPSGQPVVFLADHPITGGYPVVGTVVSADIPLLAQARPGQRVIFRPTHL